MKLKNFRSRFDNKNTVRGGRLYHFDLKDAALKQLVEGVVTRYQKHHEGVSRRLVLGTTDGSPKKDLQLLREAIPTPVAFPPDPLNFGDIVLDHPSTWHEKTKNTSDDFAEIAEPISLEGILAPKKARRN